MLKYFYFVLITLLLFTFSFSQVTGVSEDFDNGNISRWDSPQSSNTFVLTATDSILHIAYNRSASSDAWDNFNYTPPLVDVTDNAIMTIKVKSDVGTVLTFKPIYESGADGWIQYNLPADDKWHNYIIELVNPGPLIINRIYMYLDGGSTLSDSGNVYFDDLRIGDSVRVIDTIDLTVLERAINDAVTLRDNSTEGSGEGEYPAGSKSTLTSEISNAEIALNNSNMTKEVFDQAVWDMYNACVNFEISANISRSGLVDDEATKETNYLYFNLKMLKETTLFFGMHDATGYGVGWQGDDDRSDVKDVCGSMPALFSEDMNGVTRNREVARIKYRLTNAYNEGSFITMCWHQYDPQDRGFYSSSVNEERVVSTILPGGIYHDNYKVKLKRIALFLKSLRGKKGENIPVIFRPYHEHIGDWFWWGPSWCSTQEYNEIWQFTYHYLVDSLNVHNTIWALSPSMNHVENGDDYYNVYPGDDYVDIFGTDQYFGYPITDGDILRYKNAIRNLVGKAENKDKIFALTEVGDGSENLSSIDFFTRVMSSLAADTTTAKTSYAAVWRNASTIHHFAPYPGDPSVPDFLTFYNDVFSIFQDNIPNMYILGSMDTIPPAIVKYPEKHFVAYDLPVEIVVETNERAFTRFSSEDVDFSEMTNEFSEGQGTFKQTTYINAAQGESYTYYIRTSDYYGNKSTSSYTVSFDVDTLKKPVEWYDPRYPSEGWNYAPAPFEYSADPGKTGVPYSRTVYFKREFEIENAADYYRIDAITNYDNAAVYYLNGHELYRYNMPGGMLDYYTWAIENKSGVKSVTFDSTDMQYLRDGTNTIAVEIHQASDDSLDMMFDLKLISPDVIFDFGSDWFYFSESKMPDSETEGSVGIEDDSFNIPGQINLYPNYPNPFNPSTTIRFSLKQNSNVTITVYDVMGRRVRNLVNKFFNLGFHNIVFKSEGMASGTYYYQLQTAGKTMTRKMLLMK